ncbi:transporter [Stenomitos frigidus ULC18]|uniref:Transporter n=2 Tax=Stenomitos TaxID=1844270 RepID=A0A2T1DTI9_9CYAN|nr:transporter [Stenomitos frigidus ULC18]
MQISGRNGTVKAIEIGAVNAEVETAAGVEMTAMITKASAENLGLSVGKEAYAVVKTSGVMVAID